MKKALALLGLVTIATLTVVGCAATTSNTDSEPAYTEQPYTEEPAVEEPAEPEMTMGQEQAVAKGRDYLDYSAFSRKGLIDQLVYEGFNKAEAAFAVDYISPNWNKQAAKKAKDYLEYSSFSRQGLIDQLVYEGFTKAQAEYGVKAVGY